MLLSEFIKQVQEKLALHGDAELVEMHEAGGELDYFEVTGVSLDDWDGGDNEAPGRMYVINTQY